MKKYIHAYMVGGQTLYTGLKSWSDSDLNGNKSLIITDNSSEVGYDDISTIQNWEKYGSSHSEKREQIKIIFEETDWESISLDDKKIVTKYFLVEKSLRDEVYSDSEQNSFDYPRIINDVKNGIPSTDFISINYKTQINSDVSYTPIFYFHTSGENTGLIEKTEYYKNYVDDNNKGELILVVEENYNIDDSNLSIPYTARPVLSRSKTWKWVNMSGNFNSETKVKDKLYNTRKKRSEEARRRRNNVVEQLIDSVALAGILSGTFSDEDDAFDSLVSLQEIHVDSFTSWIASGRGSLIDVVENDSTTTWLDNVIPNTPQTQAMCSWMIGLSFRYYIKEKLKGNLD